MHSCGDESRTGLTARMTEEARYRMAACCLALLVLGGAAFVAGCESGGDSPGGHTLSLGGVSHLEGHTDPLANCTSCHGAALRGGSGPSCFSCHDTGDHTASRGGRRHRAGVAGSCTACHGPDNSGGLGPACAACH